MASHGRRGVTALLLGSETQKVLTHTTHAGARGALKRRSAAGLRARAWPRSVGASMRMQQAHDEHHHAQPAASQASCASVSRQGRRCCSCGIRSATAT